MAQVEKQTILVVDDTPENIDVLKGILGGEYKIKFAVNGTMALQLVEKSPPDIILLDVMMPGIDGFEVCQRLKKNPLTRAIPVIFVTAKSETGDEEDGFKIGAVDYITKPVVPSIVKARVETHLALSDQKGELVKEVARITAELNETRFEIIKKLGRAAEYKDNETGLHVVRMSHYCYHIARQFGFQEHDASILLQASPMHDIGKIGIPDSILKKPGKLDEKEWELMKTHTSIGGEIIGTHDAELLKIARIVCDEHHEKWNGQGYPLGLQKDEIDLYSRITSVADVFDALTSKRPYKEEWPLEDAVNYIQKESGESFDPKVVDAFNKALPMIATIKEKHHD